MNKVLILLSVIVFTVSCNQDIDLKLPPYQSKIVVECYLIDGLPMICSLQESELYTAPFGVNLINDAEVVISHNGINDTLANISFFSTLLGITFNYTSLNLLQVDYNSEYTLTIKDKKGRTVTGKTMILPPVPIDTLFTIKNEKNQYAINFTITDPPEARNFYRHVSQRPRLNERRITDFTVEDQLFNGQKFNFFTFGNPYEAGDTVVTALYNVNEDYFNYIRSVGGAIRSNLNPFAQTSSIQSNVNGGVGIFTSLNADVQINIIR